MLGEEIDNMFVIASLHGYKSNLIYKGIELRNQINSLEYD